MRETTPPPAVPGQCHSPRWTPPCCRWRDRPTVCCCSFTMSTDGRYMSPWLHPQQYGLCSQWVRWVPQFEGNLTQCGAVLNGLAGHTHSLTAVRPSFVTREWVLLVPSHSSPALTGVSDTNLLSAPWTEAEVRRPPVVVGTWSLGRCGV